MGKTRFFILVILLVVDMGHGRIIRNNSSDYLVSDGISYVDQPPITSPVTCELTYGFLPCTTNVWGHLFLIVIYQYLLFLADGYVSAGSDLIFKILGPGIFGASAFHILGAFPEAALVLVSALYGSKDTAQNQVIGGMCFLAGSTVMLLTLVWGSCLFVGKYDLSAPSTAFDTQDTKRLSLTGSGVITDPETSYTARIMVLSLIPFIIAQLPHIFNPSSQGRVAILISLIVTLALLFLYCFYQIFQPWIQDRRLEYLMHKYMENIIGGLLTYDGKPNTPIIRELFHKIDQNKDMFITPVEIRALILGIQFEEVGLNKEDFMVKVMKEFDTSGDAHIDEKEFIRGISKWLSETKQSVDKRRHHRQNRSNNFSQKTEEEQAMLLDHRDKDEHGVNPFWTYLKAASLLLLGTFILAILAAPLIDSVQSFSSAANIPSFFISFTVVPFAINYREAVSTITSARQKKRRSASLIFSEIYGAVFMNNIVGLSIFLGIFYARGFTWDFSAEVLVVLIICTVMGLLTGFRTTFPLWTSFVAYLLYPISLILVYVLTYSFGWS